MDPTETKPAVEFKVGDRVAAPVNVDYSGRSSLVYGVRKYKVGIIVGRLADGRFVVEFDDKRNKSVSHHHHMLRNRS